MSEAHVYEELANIVTNAPVFSGNTISHRTANACGERGWAKRNGDGDWTPTPAGRKALRAWLEASEDDARGGEGE